MLIIRNFLTVSWAFQSMVRMPILSIRVLCRNEGIIVKPINAFIMSICFK